MYLRHTTSVIHTLWTWQIEVWRSYSPPRLFIWMLFLSLLFAGLKFQHIYYHQQYSTPLNHIAYFLMAFFIAAILFSNSCAKSASIIKRGYTWFWGIVLAILLGLNESFVDIGIFVWLFSALGMASDVSLYYGKMLSYMLRTPLFYLVIPFLIWWFLAHISSLNSSLASYQPADENDIFMWRKKLAWKFYLPLLPLIAIPVIMAGFTDNFLAFYPRVWLYGNKNFSQYFPLNVWLFEFFYVLQFIALECFFRGFIIRRLQPTFGLGSIWIMAGWYFLIHLHKPVVEAVSSFFGGVLLGIVAYKTNSCKGGAMLHIFIAVLMELTAGLIMFYRGTITLV